MSVEDLEKLEGLVKFDIDLSKIENGIDIVSFLAESNIFPSKGEARKNIQNGGVSINRKKITDIQMKIEKEHLLHDKYILVQRGKRNYYLICVV